MHIGLGRTGGFLEKHRIYSTVRVDAHAVFKRRSTIAAGLFAMKSKKTEVLEQLLGCYLHQDWVEEFTSDAAALQAIIESEPKEQVVAGIAEIDAILAATLSDSELRTLFVDQIGCYFDPGSEELTYEQWLSRVRNIFSKA